eukprot:9761186-Ditylum_brightwellii.AAC.1
MTQHQKIDARRRKQAGRAASHQYPQPPISQVGQDMTTQTGHHCTSTLVIQSSVVDCPCFLSWLGGTQYQLAIDCSLT